MFFKKWFNWKKSPGQVVWVSNEGELLSKEGHLLIKDTHIQVLNEEIEKLTKEKIKLKRKKQPKLMDEVMKVFKNASEEMSATDVFLRIDKKKLRNKHTKISAVRAILYYLRNIEQIEHGVKRGTFRLKRFRCNSR